MFPRGSHSVNANGTCLLVRHARLHYGGTIKFRVRCSVVSGSVLAPLDTANDERIFPILPVTKRHSPARLHQVVCRVM